MLICDIIITLVPSLVIVYTFAQTDKQSSSLASYIGYFAA